MSAQPGLVHDGNYLVTFVPAADGIVDPSAPTVTELEAGIPLECQITPDGLAREASDEMVDTSRLCSVFTTQRIGRTSFEVSLTLVRLDEANLTGTATEDTAYNTLQKGTIGYLVIRDNKSANEPWTAGSVGPPEVLADTVEVYYVECGTRSKATPAANEQMTFTVPMSVLAEPNLDVAVVTGA